MITLIIILVVIQMAMVPMPTEIQPDIIPCKDGYQIVYDNGDGTYDEYFVCDTNAIKELLDQHY